MVQYPRHAVVEFHPDWAIKSWHCVLCGSQCDSQEQLKSHLQIHEIKDVIATVITTGNLQNGAAINFKHSFITDSTADVSISTGDVAAHVKKEINDSDDYMPLEEVESDNESFGAKLEPNDDDSEIPEFKIEAVHSDDNEMETSFTYDENANSPEETIKFNCNYCDKSFDSKPKLERHQKLNHEVLVCPVRNCTQKLVDVNHIMKHSTISPRFKSQRVAQTATKTSLSAGQSSQDEKSSVPVLPPENPPELEKCTQVDRESSVHSTSEPLVIKTEPTETKHKKKRQIGFICHQCGAIFSNKQKFSYHLRVHFKQFVLCHICGRKSPSDHNRKRHFVDVHKGPRSFSCKACGTSYGSWRTMYEHQVSVHNYNAMAVCRLCVKGFDSAEQKDLHEMTFHPGLPETNEVLLKHIDKFFIEKDGKLVLCKYGDLKQNATAAVNVETETIDDIFFEPPVVQTVSKEERKQKYNDNRKQKRMLKQYGITDDMEICEETVKSKNKKDIGETEVCDHGSATDSNVVLNFSKRLPPKSFKRKRDEAQHIDKSNKKRNRKISLQSCNFKCDQCGRCYSTRSTLRQHQQIHNRLVCLCHICGKASTGKNNRKQHFIHFHKGPKEFECKECFLAFATWPNVYLHLRETHGFDKLAICRLCAAGFQSVEDRVDHEKEMHPKLPELREDLLEHVNEPFVEETKGKYVLSIAAAKNRKHGTPRIRQIPNDDSEAVK